MTHSGSHPGLHGVATAHHAPRHVRPPHREAIALALAAGNVDRCGYCQSAHTVAAKAAGLSPDASVAIREDRVDFDPSAQPCWR